ncbi:hypothetical protein OH460_07560 [Vibrio sp. Makdt]|uniref:hypothetical protein n=1 Tax=Vibrio sp. Makdt TaxID=2998828 RepID=UPI0022CD61ED|nr:hypothetical protein [Vibrio sp. Makdt]MDA0152154.1 hypothetical protein [Vibrio sp. Makdt]
MKDHSNHKKYYALSPKDYAMIFEEDNSSDKLISNNKAYMIELGFKFFNNNEELLQAAVKSQGLTSLEEIAGNEIEFTQNNESWTESMHARGIDIDLDDTTSETYIEYFANFTL